MKVSKILAVLVRPSKISYNSRRSLTKTRRLKASLTAVFSFFIATTIFVSLHFSYLVMTPKAVAYSPADLPRLPLTVPQDYLDLEPIVVKAALPPGIKVEVQNAIGIWTSKYNKTGVVITNLESGELLGSSQADMQFYPASIYKLYTVYFALQDIDKGVHLLTDPYLDGNTRGMCLDRMIRFSDNACGEKMLSEMGTKQLTSRMTAVGCTGTSLVKFLTTAHDAALITQKIALGENLSKQSTDFLQTAMVHQKYDTGLKLGFKDFQVYDKVGINDEYWHDTVHSTAYIIAHYNLCIFGPSIRHA